MVGEIAALLENVACSAPSVMGDLALDFYSGKGLLTRL